MKRIANVILLTVLLVTSAHTQMWAEEALPQKLQTLADEAYRALKVSRQQT